MTVKAPPLNQGLNLLDVMAITNLSRSTIFSKLSPASRQYDPSFPRPIPVSARRRIWQSSTIDAWLESRAQSSTTVQGAKP